MKVLPFFFLLFLSVSPLVSAQTALLQTDASVKRPLNLSVRKHLAPVTDATVILIDPKVQATDVDASLPYGSGFESRQQGSTSAGNGNSGSSGRGASSGGAGGSGSGGGSGNGGGSGGGSGRGR
ncbi:hypothetical protein [Rhodoferax sp.]|uniref:hypothetical protein n=1 Tax=Rhodoferax sp. TaxID=50421 RepID=UPI00283D13C7|nr:hypothetical protein [Rhodoferax sp.]MDR3367864.1 hypothetical protein [Rhodoferax sp.]